MEHQDSLEALRQKVLQSRRSRPQGNQQPPGVASLISQPPQHELLLANGLAAAQASLVAMAGMHQHSSTVPPPPPPTSSLLADTPAAINAPAAGFKKQHQRVASLEEGEIASDEVVASAAVWQQPPAISGRGQWGSLAQGHHAESSSRQTQSAPKKKRRPKRRHVGQDEPQPKAPTDTAAKSMDDDDDFSLLLQRYSVSKNALSNSAQNSHTKFKKRPANPNTTDDNMTTNSALASDHPNSTNTIHNGVATTKAVEPLAYSAHTPFVHPDNVYAPMYDWLFPFATDAVFLPPEAWQQFAHTFPPPEPQRQPADIPLSMDSKEHSERVNALVQELRLLGVRKIDLEKSGIDPAIQAMVLQGPSRPPPPPPPPQHQQGQPPPPPPPPPIDEINRVSTPSQQNDLLVISLKNNKTPPLPRRSGAPSPEAITVNTLNAKDSKPDAISPAAATAEASSASQPAILLPTLQNGASSTTTLQLGGEEDLDAGEEDMDLDDDEDGPTILAGTWKTVQAQNQSASTTLSTVPPAAPSVNFSNNTATTTTPNSNSGSNNNNATLMKIPPTGVSKSTIHMDPNRFPAAAAALSQVSTGRVVAPSHSYLPMGTHPRRLNAHNFARGRHHGLFVKERSQSFVIDLDDDGDDSEDGDSESGEGEPDRASSAVPNNNSKATPSSMKDRSLEELQAKLKVLNELIRMKELARMASPSTTPIDSPTTQEGMEEQGNNTENGVSFGSVEMEGSGATTEQVLQATLAEQNRNLLSLQQSVSLSNSEFANATQDYEQSTSEWIQSKTRVQMLEHRSSQSYERLKEKEREVARARQEWQQAMEELGGAKAQVTANFSKRTALKTRMDELEARSKSLKESIALLQKQIALNRGRLQQAQGDDSQTSTTTSTSAATTTPAAVPQEADAPATNTANVSNGTLGQNNQSASLQEPTSLPEAAVTTTTAQAGGVPKTLTATKRTVSTTSTDSEAAQKKQRLEAERLTEKMLLKERMNSLAKEQKKLKGASTLHSPKSRVTPSPIVQPTPSSSVVQGRPSAPDTLPALDQFLDQVKSTPAPPVPNVQDTKTHVSRAHSWRTPPSIQKLFAVDQYTVALDRLCFPSDLIDYPLPEGDSRSVVDLSTNNRQQSIGTANGSVSAVDSNAVSLAIRPKGYESPLKMFRSYRFSTNFAATTKGGLRSLTYSNKIDPNKKMCLFELSGGACNDDKCESLHLRDCGLTDDELVVDLAKYTEGDDPTSQQKFLLKETSNLSQLRTQGIRNADVLAGYVVDMHRKAVGNTYEVVKFGDRVGEESVSKPNSARPSVIDRLLRESSNQEETVNFEQYPVLLKAIVDELLAAASDKPVKSAPKRYYEVEKPISWYDEKLVKDGHNVSLWIEYALVALREALENAPPDFLNPVESPPMLYHEPLSILALGLALNPESEALWSFKLELATLQGSEDEVRDLFNQAIEYVPHSRLIWWRFFLWEKNRDQKAFVLDRMLENACVNRKPGESQEQQSNLAVDVVLQIVKLLSSAGLVETAKNWMETFLSSPEWEGIHPSSLSLAQPDGIWCDDGHEMVDVSATFAAKILVPNSLCVLWLAYIHLVWNHELPAQLFHLPPNDYLSDPSLFTIHWSNVDEVEDDNELHHIVSDIFLGLVLHFIDSEAKPCVVAIMKNYVDFMLARQQNVEDILDMIRSSKGTASFAEIHDIESYIHLQFKDEDAAQRALENAIVDLKHDPFSWNRRLQLAKTDEARQECLIQCALSYFEVKPEQMAEAHSANYVILLYKKLLGLDLPVEFSAPKPTHEIAMYPKSAMLWINYLCLLAIQGKTSGSFVELEKAYVFAIASLSDELRPMLREDYAVHMLLQNLAQASKPFQFGHVMTRALEGIPVSQRHPYDHAPAKSKEVISPVTNAFYLNRVVERILKRIASGDVSLRIDILEAFMRQFPQDPDLYLWMGEAQETAGNTQHCRNIMVLMTRRFSINEDLWRITNQLFVTPNSKESHDLMSKASVFSPWAARFVQAPMLFSREASITEQPVGGASHGGDSPTEAAMMLDD
ncbi:Zinc finger C3H1 domain-containing protein [Actinomortierella ambigua]|nr:Zinc finger C3H1 domain-containing protein [Actinomortierella ambigua]